MFRFSTNLGLVDRILPQGIKHLETSKPEHEGRKRQDLTLESTSEKYRTKIPIFSPVKGHVVSNFYLLPKGWLVETLKSVERIGETQN